MSFVVTSTEALISPAREGYVTPDGQQLVINFYRFIPPQPPPGPQTFPPAVRDWWDCDEWGRFFPGNCVRR